MRGMRFRPAPALLAAAALLVVPAAAQARTQKTMVIKVTSVSVRLTTADKPPKGASKGDTVRFTDELVNAVAQFGKQKGAKVGTDSGTMTLLGPSSARFDGRAVLPGGTLRLRGAVTSAGKGSITIPVAGGTGRFRGAHGHVLVGPGSKRSLNVYTLTLPLATVA
jgi:hypothetical protein